MSTPHMRLTTAPQTPGMPIEINGVKIPVDSWTVSPIDYGQSSGSVQVDLRFYADLAAGPEPETAEQRAARIQAEEAAELAALVAEWQTARDEAGSPAVQAVFDLHNPRRRYQAIECDHCQLSSGTPEADHAVWPCDTYTALTGAPDQAAAPDPRALAPMEISLTVQPGLSDEQLHAAISDAIRHSTHYR